MLIEEHMEHFGFFDIVDVVFEKPSYGLKVYKNINELIETELTEIIRGIKNKENPEEEDYQEYKHVYIM